jgi:hypothetical protein
LLFFRGLAANWRSKIAPQMPRLPSMITVSVGTTVRRQHSRSWPFLFELKGIPAQYGVDIKRAIEMGGITRRTAQPFDRFISLIL